MSYTNSLGQPDLVDYMRMIERRLARLERGVQGSSGGDDPAVILALTISGLALSTQTVIAADDFYRVMMRYSWSAIPDDPSEYNKDGLDGYLTSWSINGVNYSPEQFTDDTSIDVGPFTQGQSVTFRVRARTRKGTLGPYTSRTDSTTTDATAPFQPSTPVVSPYLGQLAIDWNGLDVSAGQPPTDFRFVEVHLSTSGPTFTPTVSTLVGTILRGGGTWVATDLTYATTYYARLVAVDTVGNRSPASTAGSAIPELLVNADVGPNAIATANIQNLAVNNAKISDLSVGKLTVGTLTANMTVSARIMTAATGARVELNTAGLQAFNSGGGQTVDIASTTGAVTITGKFQTAFPGSGTPYLDMTDSGDRTTINMYNAAGTNGAFINSPQDVNNVSMLGLNTGSFTYGSSPSTTSRHRLFLANASGIFLESYKATGGTCVGGRLYLGPTSGYLQAYNGTGNVQNGGVLYFDQGTIKLGVTNTGTTSAEIALFEDDSIWVTGRWSGDNSIGGDSALFVGLWNAAGTTYGFSYGVTMTTRPLVLFSIQRTTTTTTGLQGHVSAFSTTGFDITTTDTGGTLVKNISYWCFRWI
jgi:hypothetical protein